MFSNSEIQQAVINLRSSTADANHAFYQEDWEWNDPAWYIENCFLQLIAITEAAGLTEMNRIILQDYHKIKRSKTGFRAEEKKPDDEPYPIHLSRARQFFDAIEAFFPAEEHTKVTKDLLQIIRDAQYVITDRALFGKVPQNENDVHLRIEGILKPVFPDLKHKPALTKPIKNFEPDTGIPSLHTLIEYKFLSKRSDAPTLADQILADTRGYVSEVWNRLICVVYETGRFKTEQEWNDLLEASRVTSGTRVIVLNGVPVK